MELSRAHNPGCQSRMPSYFLSERLQSNIMSNGLIKVGDSIRTGRMGRRKSAIVMVVSSGGIGGRGPASSGAGCYSSQRGVIKGIILLYYSGTITFTNTANNNHHGGTAGWLQLRPRGSGHTQNPPTPLPSRRCYVDIS